MRLCFCRSEVRLVLFSCASWGGSNSVLGLHVAARIYEVNLNPLFS
jgi:hypothetical protein